MRQSSSRLPEVLTGSFTWDVRVNVWHGPNRVAEGLRVESWSLDADLGREVKTTGSMVVVHESVHGESMKPRGTDGVLSPFRAVVEPIVTISAGSFSEDVSLGQFRVTRVPESEEFTVDTPFGRRVVWSRAELEFASLDVGLQRWGLRFPETPPSLVSAWDEVRRLSGMPVFESVPDVRIPGSTVWEAKQGGRLEAVQKLADMLGGVAVVNSVGALVVVPDEVGDPVLTLTVGENGTIVDVGDEIDTDAVYNQVVGVFEKENRDPIYAVAQVTDGPLSVNGPYGVYTRYYASDLVRTQAQADAAVKSVLDLSIGGQTYDVPVTCHFNPLVEIGDVVEVVTEKRVDGQMVTAKTGVVGRAVKVGLSDDALMSVTVRVARSLS